MSSVRKISGRKYTVAAVFHFSWRNQNRSGELLKSTCGQFYYLTTQKCCLKEKVIFALKIFQGPQVIYCKIEDSKMG